MYRDLHSGGPDYCGLAWANQSFFKDFFDVDHFEVFIEFVTICLLFCVLDFWPEAYGILAVQAGIKPVLLASKDDILATEQPEKFLILFS